MSKKINIRLNKDGKPNLVLLFHSSIRNKKPSSKRSIREIRRIVEYYFPNYFIKDMPDEDVKELYDYNRLDEIEFAEEYDANNGKGKKAKVVDINTPYNGFIDDDDYYDDEKIIYFYPDYHSKYEYEKFTSIKEFDEYCSDMGYYVSPFMGELLAYSTGICHCCIDRESRDKGIMAIIVCDSYADMFYSVCLSSELGIISD